MTIDTTQYKALLESEEATLISELNSVGARNPNTPGDWVGKPDDVGSEHADKNDVADNIEQFESNAAVVNELEVRLNSVQAALKRITDGTYGTCEISGKPIEEDRLRANPAARTSKEYMNQEQELG
jgi:RNA polymerase-binding transcription factor DksA